MLCLADEVGGHKGRLCSGVGKNGNLGSSGLRVDAHHTLDEPLGCGHEDVAGPVTTSTGSMGSSSPDPGMP